MADTPTLADFSAQWIFERLIPDQKKAIEGGTAKLEELTQSVRQVILRGGLLDKYDTQYQQHTPIDDTTVFKLASEVTQGVIKLCQTA